MRCSKPATSLCIAALLVQLGSCSRFEPTASVERAQAKEKAPKAEAVLAIDVGQGVVSIQAKQVPLDSVLRELSERLPFKLTYSISSAPLVSVAINSVRLPQLLDELSQGIGYHAEYSPEPNELGFRILSLSVGIAADQLSQENAIAATAQSADESEFFALTIDDVFVGHGEFEKQLALRLVDVDPEQRAIAVRDLRATPAEFAVAEKMFRHDSAPEVAIAALQLAESENLYAANKMIVDALNHADPAPVLYALDIIDRRLDYTLMPRIEELHSNPHTSVQQKSLEVWEALRDAYALRN